MTDPITGKRRVLAPGKTLHVPLMAMDSSVDLHAASVLAIDSAQRGAAAAFDASVNRINDSRHRPGDGPDASALAMQVAARDALLSSSLGTSQDSDDAYMRGVAALNSRRDK